MRLEAVITMRHLAWEGLMKQLVLCLAVYGLATIAGANQAIAEKRVALVIDVRRRERSTNGT